MSRMFFYSLFMNALLLPETAGSIMSDKIDEFMNDQQVAYQSQQVLLQEVDSQLETLSLRLEDAESSQNNHSYLIGKLQHVKDDIAHLQSLGSVQDRRLDVLESFMDRRAGYAALHYTDCTLESTGRLFFDRTRQKLTVCNGTAWVMVHQPQTVLVSSASSDSSQPQPSTPRDCAEIAADSTNTESGFYDILLQGKVTKVYCDLQANVSYGGDGLTEDSAGFSCTTIREYWKSSQSGLRWINPSASSYDPFQIYCDFESFGGGWNLLFSSRATEDYSVMVKGTRNTANITSLDSHDNNNRFAYDVFKAINTSAYGYTEVMLSGYRDFRAKGDRVKMYFSKEADRGISFTQFVEYFSTYWRGDCNVGSYYGTEISSGKPIALSWEFRAFSAGSATSSCSWFKEVWNDINGKGGHLLEPTNWDHAEDHAQQTTAGGACHSRGVYHIFIR
ncbi:uncharacterized protein [Oscarella lobularis]